jgi:hypothetical protein
MKTLLVVLCLLAGLQTRASAQATWQWARHVQAVSVGATAADAAGNVYVAGSFTAPVSFTSPYFAGTLTLSPFGSRDIFLGCFDAAGHLRWARQTGGSGASATGSAVAIDGAGGVYVVGSFMGTLTTNLGGPALTAGGYNSALVLRYAAGSGTAQWSRKIGNDNYNCGGLAVAVGPGNGCYVGGFLSTTVSFGSFSATGGRRSAFVALYSAAGAASWATVGHTNGPTFSTSGSDATALATDAAGNCYVTGPFSTGLQLGGATLPDNGWFTRQAFVARLSAATGAATWLTGTLGANSSSSAQGTGLAVQGGACYVGGSFGGTETFGGGYTLSSGGVNSSYLARHDAATGATSWVRPLGLGATGVAVAASSSSVLATLGISASPGYAKLAAYAPTGIYQWALSTTGPGSSRAAGLALSGAAVYWLGSYENSGGFGPFALTTPASTTYGYLARLNLPAARMTELGTVEAYPNPAQDALQVQWRAPEPRGRVQVTVRDAFGRVLLDAPYAGNEALRLDVHGWQPGLYYVQLRGAGLHETRPVRVK